MPTPKNILKVYFNYDIIQVWSVFGPEPASLNKNPKILTVQWSGESNYKNTKILI